MRRRPFAIKQSSRSQHKNTGTNRQASCPLSRGFLNCKEEVFGRPFASISPAWNDDGSGIPEDVQFCIRFDNDTARGASPAAVLCHHCKLIPGKIIFWSRKAKQLHSYTKFEGA